ncbi:MFS general substrate transporter-14 [Coleophoma cylindrospora]|uniref:MFS general substrate transporter-14 n=1 Tax=Coleophoma cylindrospora TaxID=1849047 RepID=A0A3D8QKM2_9HELO|nr:MFS general substrate transporter-14 [Coleophoma cylindrospora]
MCSFISPATSSIVAPSLSIIARDLHIANAVEQQMVLSIAYLGYAVGLLLFGQLSEVFGRLYVMHAANLLRLLFNVACAVSANAASLIACRFCAGVVGSAPLAISGGVLSDIWRAEERGAAFSMYALVPLLGSALGPVAGGYITERTSWRWCFYAAAMMDGAIQLLSIACLRETYAPTLLQKQARQARKATGNENLRAEGEDLTTSLAEIARKGFVRPCILLATQPIVQVLAIYMAYVYGLAILVLSSFTELWTATYHESIGTAGLNYIALGIGYISGTQICALFNDRAYSALKARAGGIGRPEFRIPLMLPSSIMVPAGLVLYGWAGQYHVHWAVPNLGAAIFAAGVEVLTQCVQTYLVDAYSQYAASALSAASTLRYLAGFTFPMFAPEVYRTLDYGWGNSLLALLALGLGLPAPLLLWFKGQALRERSSIAANE